MIRQASRERQREGACWARVAVRPECSRRVGFCECGTSPGGGCNWRSCEWPRKACRRPRWSLRPGSRSASGGRRPLRPAGPSWQRRGRAGLPPSPPAAAATAAATGTAAAGAAGPLLRRPRFVHSDGSPVKGLSAKQLNRLAGLGAARHLHEPEAAGTPGVAVGHYSGAFHSAGLLEEGLEALLCGVKGQTTNIQLVRQLGPPISPPRLDSGSILPYPNNCL